MKNSAIEWTDHTFNPWIGCTKVSPGCLNCYAETLDKNRLSKTLPGCSKEAPVSHWGKGAPRQRTVADNWKQPGRWNSVAEQGLFRELYDADGKTVIFRGDLRSKDCPRFDGERKAIPVRPRVFCASLADWLDDEVTVEWLADLLDLVRRTPHLDWLLLTKRPQNWRSRIKEARDFALQKESWELHTFIHRWLDRSDLPPPANVWIGTTVEDQTRADERIPALLAIPARVRFLSCEPLLGPVDLRQKLYATSGEAEVVGYRFTPGIDWIIVGGESGHGARPMHPQWARSLRDQCAAAGVAFFFKQWGEWLPDNQRDWRSEVGEHEFGILNLDGTRLNHRCGYNAPSVGLLRVGKKTAGRLLDGRQHDGFPEGKP